MDSTITLTEADKVLLYEISRTSDSTIVLQFPETFPVAERLVDAGLLTEVGTPLTDGAKIFRATTRGRARIHELWPDAAVGTLPYGLHTPPSEPVLYLYVTSPTNGDPEAIPPQLSPLASIYNTIAYHVRVAPYDARFWLNATAELTAARAHYHLAARRARRAAKKTAASPRRRIVVRTANLLIWAAAVRELAALYPVLVTDQQHPEPRAALLAEAQRQAADVAEALAGALDTPVNRRRPAARADIEQVAGELLDRLRFHSAGDCDLDDPNSLLNELKRALSPHCGSGVQALSLLASSPKRRRARA